MTVDKRLMSCRVPVNEDEARQIVEAEEDPISRELMRMAIAVAAMRFLKVQGLTEMEFAKQLPDAPFDLAFFAKVMQAFFKQRSTLEGIMKGQTIAAASGWDDQ